MSITPTHLFNQEVTVEPLVLRTRNRAPSYGTAVTVKCRVEYGRKELRGRDGDVLISEARIYCGPDEVVDNDSRVTLPDGTQQQVLFIEPGIRGSGVSVMKKVVLGVKSSGA